MKIYIIIPLLALWFNTMLAQQGETDGFITKADQIISAQFKSGDPGAVVLISRKGEIIYEKAFGMSNMELDVPMQPNNVFKIGSITKQFTAVAILQLMEQGKLDLQDSITRFIPDFPSTGNNITIENLLNHTSGIKNFSEIRDTVQRGRIDFTPAEMIDYFKNEPMRFIPGTKWEYSNSNYVLLGSIIEIITGESYGEYINNNFFKPLGMEYSNYGSEEKIIKNRVDGYSISETGFLNAAYLSVTQPYAAGSILSSAGDLHKWNRALHSYKLIKKETLDKALSRYKLSGGGETNYGYGFRLGFIQDSEAIWHGGLINGFTAMAIYLPAKEIFVTLLSNCDCTSPGDLTVKLAALAAGKPDEYTEILMENNLLHEFSGVYENYKGQLRIVTPSENQLYIQLGRAPKNIVIPYDKDKFHFKDDILHSLEFIRDSNRKVVQLITKTINGKETWNKTDKPIPSAGGIQLQQKILENYTGKYILEPEFTFTITREKQRLFVQAVGDDKFEIYAESETGFFTKINDAEFEFLMNEKGKVTGVIVSQNGRSMEAKKVN